MNENMVISDVAIIISDKSLSSIFKIWNCDLTFCL